MPEIETERTVTDGVLRDVDFSRRGRAVMPALDYLAEQGLSMVSVPLYPAPSSGVVAAPKSYTVLVTRDERRLCIPTADLPLRMAMMPTFVDQESRWPEPLLRGFLEGNYIPPRPEELFGTVAGLFAKYLDVAPVETRILAAFTLCSYWFPAWAALGILHVQGPFSSGKSRVLTLLQHLAFAPISMASATAASLFKVCGRATCLLDEAEMMSTAAMKEARLILQASYRQQGGSVIRCSGRGRVARWPVYGPKAIASVADLPADGVLASRCIVLRLHRSTDVAKTGLRLDEMSEDFGAVRAAMFSTALTRWRDLIATPVDGGGLAARRLECFFPLLQVAGFCDPTGAAATEIAAYALRSDTPAVQATPLTGDERKVAEALSTVPDDNQERTSAQLRDVVVGRFPELASMTPAAMGLILAKHGLVTKRHTPQGKLYLVQVQRAALLSRA